MTGKLIKKDDHYFLEVEPYTLSTLQKHTIIANTFDKPKGDILQLSLKNCQAIERGYDLDELADEYCTHEPKNAKELRDVNLAKLGFRDGFQKALELNADKRFTLKEMTDCWNKALTFQTHKETLGEHIQSLQQKEWEVEIELVSALSNSGNVYYGDIPKLDLNGCLILKRAE